MFQRALIVFMDTKRSAPETRTGNPDPASAEDRHLLFWPASSGEPHAKHYLKAVAAPSAHEDRPVYFVTLDVEREESARTEFAAALGTRLRALRGERSRQEVASYLGRHQNTIAKFERGDALPDAWEIERLCRLFEISSEALFDVRGQLPETSGLLSDEFVMVPEYSVRASAGLGAVVNAEDVIGRFAFRRAWLESRGIRAENLAVVGNDGDSMEPTVRDHDILLVDVSVRSLRAEGIYLIEQAGELRCKRLQALVGGGVKIRSDNPKYETEVVPAERADLLRIVAKVIWIGGER